MSWAGKFIGSSIGQKIIMSLSGLFLIIFLLIHLIGNLQLLKSDGGIAFNSYGYFMTHNPLIKIVSYTLYITILIHAIQGTKLFFRNRSAKGTGYAVATNTGQHWASRYMMHFGAIIFVFILIHLCQFWLQMKMGTLEMVTVAGMDHPIADLYKPCYEVFGNIGFVLFYVISMAILAFHLAHGFSSAFQSLGINHKKYTPLIKFIGLIYSILIPIGFALIPIWMFLNR